MKKVWVSGGAGFIGSNLVKALSDKGFEVKAFDDLSLGRLENLEGNYIFEKGSVLDYGAVEKSMIGYDTVVHLAALPRVQPSIENPLPAHEVNVTGTLNVLEAARKNTVEQVIYAGSSSIFGKTATMPIKENNPKNPGSPYSLQKYISEQYIELYEKLYGLRSTILRFFNVYGPKMPRSGPYAVVVGIFLDQKAHGLPLTIKGEGNQLRDFTWIGDICEGIISAGVHRAFGIYHLGSGSNISIHDLAEAIDPGGKRIFVEASKGDYSKTLADISRARRELGYLPTVNVLEWCKEMANPSLTINREVVYSK